jgi:hypothetical protein
MIPIDIQIAVEKARREPHGKFVFIEAGASAEVRDALTAFAAESGREVLNKPGESRLDALAREAAARDVPLVNAGDNRDFIDKLKDIAAGRVKIV